MFVFLLIIIIYWLLLFVENLIMNALRVTAVFVHLDHVFIYAQDEKFLGFEIEFRLKKQQQKQKFQKHRFVLRMKYICAERK